MENCKPHEELRRLVKKPSEINRTRGCFRVPQPQFERANELAPSIAESAQEECARPLEPYEVTRILNRENVENYQRAGALEDALARENYTRVAELMKSLSDNLSQQLVEEVLELQVMKSHPKEAIPSRR
jgi:hypothetical protein